MILKNKKVINLVAIFPNQKIKGHTFSVKEKTSIRAWIKKHNGNANLYYMPNEPFSHSPNKKLKESDIRYIHATYADLDPNKSKPLIAERKRLLKIADKLKVSKYPPSIAIDSGGGIQLFWYLRKPLDAKKYGNLIKALNRGLAKQLGGDNVFNLDRLMRLPNTINLPDEKKRKAGRTKQKAVELYRTKRYSLTDLQAFIKPVYVTENSQDGNIKVAGLDMVEVKSVSDELPGHLLNKLAKAKIKYPELVDLWNGVPLDTMNATDHSRSVFDFTAAYYLKQAFNDPTEFAQVLSTLPSGKGPDGDLTEREITRIWNNVAYKTPLEEFGELPDDDDQENENAPELFKFISETEARLTVCAPKWIIRRYIEEEATGILFGPSGSGKSFLMLDWGLSITAGITWNGQSVEQGTAVIFVGEGAGGYKRRIKAWRIDHQKEISLNKKLPFYFCTEIGDLNDTKEIKKLKLTLRQLVKNRGPIRFIGIDTFSALARTDENSNKEVSALISKLNNQLRNKFKSTICIVHHSGLKEKNRVRGASAFHANVDYEYRLEGDPSYGSLYCQKLRDGTPQPPVYLEQKTIKFEAPNEDGIMEKTSSLSCRIAEGAPPEDRKILTDIQTEFLNLLPTKGANRLQWGDLYKATVNLKNVKASTLRSRIHNIPDFLWANDYVILEDEIYTPNGLSEHDVF